jgi:hypothetical protein
MRKREQPGSYPWNIRIRLRVGNRIPRENDSLKRIWVSPPRGAAGPFQKPTLGPREGSAGQSAGQPRVEGPLRAVFIREGAVGGIAIGPGPYSARQSRRSGRFVPLQCRRGENHDDVYTSSNHGSVRSQSHGRHPLGTSTVEGNTRWVGSVGPGREPVASGTSKDSDRGGGRSTWRSARADPTLALWRGHRNPHRPPIVDPGRHRNGPGQIDQTGARGNQPVGELQHRLVPSKVGLAVAIRSTRDAVRGRPSAAAAIIAAAGLRLLPARQWTSRVPRAAHVRANPMRSAICSCFRLLGSHVQVP